MRMRCFSFSVVLTAAAFLILPSSLAARETRLLNVSYDPTRELYEEINTIFKKRWKEKTGETLVIRQSHGGSGKQGRAILDGLQADVATLALAYDIDQLSKKGNLTPENWQTRLPHHSAPYTSTIVFLVRQGNPKNIHDWNDLIRPGISVVTPNPKTSGGARWNYLAAWAYGLKAFEGDELKTQDFLNKLFKNVAVLDAGARGSTTTFMERGIGDVLLSWESEAFLAFHEFGKGRVEMVVPSVSVLAEPPVTVVDANAVKHKTLEAASAYLEFLYTEEAQEIIAKHYYRPRSAAAAEKFKGRFAETQMMTIADLGGWSAVQEKHFSDGGVFDRIYLNF